MKKRVSALALGAGIVAAGVAALALRMLWPAPAEDAALMASGTVEATEVRLAFRVPGILRERPVDEGSRVEAGQLVAALDAREESARLQQAEAAALAAQAKVRDLELGYRPEEIAEARAQLRLAEVNLRNLQADAIRTEELFRVGFVSSQRRDQDATAVALAKEQRNAAAERARMLERGYRPETVNAARAEAAQAQAAVAAARVVLEDLRLASPIDGIVSRKHAEPGEALPAGAPVVTVTDLAQPWVRVYIPEQTIGKVRLGASARIRVDSFPGRDFAGRVSYVSPQAEFTPKNVQTQEERVKLVFAVNVTAPNPEGILKPGMPADVFIDTDSQGR